MYIPPLSAADSNLRGTPPASRPTDATGASIAAGRSRTDAFVQFEAFVLQSFIEAMLPKNAENVFGKGTAGGIWKSMLAEKLGLELAQSGRIGIASMLEKGAAGSRPGGMSGEDK